VHARPDTRGNTGYIVCSARSMCILCSARSMCTLEYLRNARKLSHSDRMAVMCVYMMFQMTFSLENFCTTRYSKTYVYFLACTCMAQEKNGLQHAIYTNQGEIKSMGRDEKKQREMNCYRRKCVQNGPRNIAWQRVGTQEHHQKHNPPMLPPHAETATKDRSFGS
jgi:hypothetical protein